ncbi:MAG: phage gp6-like head-tail connector protein [Clostridia bacterium]|nr:phage gp6-like head-tail connector protein [Clostridia bacterium]
MLEKVKLALLISTNDFDSELTDLIGAAFIDLNIGDVDPDKTVSSTTDPAIIRAVCCYCGYQFELLHGSIERSNAFKKSYDEQKAQMGMASGYTVWSEA